MDALPSAGGRPRVYVDMVGDLFDAGHVELLRAARSRGGWLVVGVLADEVAEAYKRRPIMTITERVAVIEACRYVDEVCVGSPFRVDDDFMVAHDIDLVVHGDDLTPEGATAVYGDALVAGAVELIPRTAGISTTDLIRRVVDAQAAGFLDLLDLLDLLDHPGRRENDG